MLPLLSAFNQPVRHRAAPSPAPATGRNISSAQWISATNSIIAWWFGHNEHCFARYPSSRSPADERGGEYGGVRRASFRSAEAGHHAVGRQRWQPRGTGGLE